MFFPFVTIFILAGKKNILFQLIRRMYYFLAHTPVGVNSTERVLLSHLFNESRHRHFKLTRQYTLFKNHLK